jgi:hypothetical protein
MNRVTACTRIHSFLERRALEGLPFRQHQNAFRVAVRRVVDLGHRVEQRRLAHLVEHSLDARVGMNLNHDRHGRTVTHEL